MAITLDKTITRDSGNIINTDTNYSELNVKANGLVEDIVDHIETELTSAEAQVNTQLTTLDNTITETLDSKNLTLQYKNDAQASAEQSASSASSASQIAIGQSTGRANIKPVLNLDFVNQKRLDSKVDFTRTSTATYYDGKKMVKAEENLLKYSEDFSNNVWAKPGSRGTYILNEIDNLGLTNAISITTTAKFNGLGQIITLKANTTYTLSFWAKSTDETIEYSIHCDEDLNRTYASYTVPTTWTKKEITFTTHSNGSVNSNVYLTQSRSSIVGHTLYIAYPQIEQRDFATAYTPATDKPITNYIPVLSTAQANEPRFDYDLETKECKGLLIEEQRTNLFSYSEDLLAYGSFQNATAISNVAISPFGTLTANKLIADTSNNTHVWYKLLTTELTSYTYSVFAKKAEKSILIMSAYWGGASTGFGINFDLENEETSFNSNVATSVTSNVTSKIENFGNGWYRCSCSWTNVDANKLVNSLTIGMSDISDYAYNPNWRTSQYIGNNFDGIYVFGLQLEQGSFATSYIPTNGSQVTRTADNCSITGDNFSSFYNPSEGTFFFEKSANQPYSGGSSSSLISFGLYDGTKSAVRLYDNIYGQERFWLIVGNTSYYSSYGVLGDYKDYKIAFTVGNSGSLISGNGVNTTSAITNSIDYPSSIQADTLKINPIHSKLNGHIKKLSYYDKALADTELQLMTEV